jgi:hypothetical protein
MIGAIVAGGLSAPTAPVTNSYESIYSTTVGSGGASSITFTSIPSTYKHLQVRGIARSTLSGAGNNIGMYMQFNSDTGSNYNWHELFGNGSGSALAYGQADSGMNVNPHSPRAGDTASCFAGNVIDILDYTNTNKNTTVRALAGNDTNGGGWMHLTSGLWRNTAAITSITLTLESSNFAEYSSFALYGIKG